MAVIDHNMNLMTGICDEFVAMELGTVITRGTPAEVLSHPTVIASYLGTEDDGPGGPPPAAGLTNPSLATTF
jgi:ABC-type uncharacterized transport system ATPase subunit